MSKALGEEATARNGGNVTVQIGIRWSPETEALVRAAKARTNKTRRALVEEAIAQVWGADAV